MARLLSRLEWVEEASVGQLPEEGLAAGEGVGEQLVVHRPQEEVGLPLLQLGLGVELQAVVVR